MLPVQLPLKGFTEQSAYSTVPEGMTPSCINVMPTDVWNGRIRIGTRNGTKKWVTSEGADIDNVQFIGSYRIYESGTLVERLIIVRNGLVYDADPQSPTATLRLFTNQSTPKLVTSGPVEGVQFHDHFYFVDGTAYVMAHLSDPVGSLPTSGVTSWGQAGGSIHGPYHTDGLGGAAAGTRATLICRWGARLVIAGYKNYPSLWFACGPDLPYPHTTGSTSSDGWAVGNLRIGAIGGSSAANNYGTVGDPIVAIFPFGQTGLMFACTNSFSFLTTDPEYDASAQMVSLTKSIGIAGRRAWCFGQEKSAYVLGRDGLYLLNPNDFNFNRGNRISAGRLDSFFLRLDFGTPAIGGSSNLAGGTLRSIASGYGTGAGASATILDDDKNIKESPVGLDIAQTPAPLSFTGTSSGEIWPVLHWDPDREGVWIFLSVSGANSASLHLYYDSKTDSFWPQRFYDPKMTAPESVIYMGESRSKNGRFFLCGEDAIVVMDKTYPVGIDGFRLNMTNDDQAAQWVRNSLTLGPILAPLPQRAFLSEIRIDLAEDQYEVPSDFEDLSTPPVVSVSSGDTAQLAVGIQSDRLFVSNIRETVVDCEDAVQPVSMTLYDGGTASTTTPDNLIDARFATKPFGEYIKADPFTSGTSASYDGPSQYTLVYEAGVWRIKWNAAQVEYEQDTTSIDPNGQYTTQIDDPVDAPPDGALVSGASFSGAEVTEVGTLVAGRNEAIKTRIRAEAMYVTVASDGRPWSIERASFKVSQVGKSRGATT
jgi:hypothetical protein